MGVFIRRVDGDERERTNEERFASRHVFDSEGKAAGEEGSAAEAEAEAGGGGQRERGGKRGEQS